MNQSVSKLVGWPAIRPEIFRWSRRQLRLGGRQRGVGPGLGRGGPGNQSEEIDLKNRFSPSQRLMNSWRVAKGGSTGAKSDSVTQNGNKGRVGDSVRRKKEASFDVAVISTRYRIDGTSFESDRQFWLRF
jgi:hypothetical protein